MQRSEIEASESEMTTLRQRVQLMEQLKDKAESMYKELLTQKNGGLMGGITGKSKLQQVQELVQLKQDTVQFYEKQLRVSDETLAASKEAWTNSSRLLMAEIQSLENTFNKTKALLEEKQQEETAGKDSLQHRYQNAIKAQLVLNESINRYEYQLMQKSQELGVAQKLINKLMHKPQGSTTSALSIEKEITGLYQQLQSPTAGSSFFAAIGGVSSHLSFNRNLSADSSDSARGGGGGEEEEAEEQQDRDEDSEGSADPEVSKFHMGFSKHSESRSRGFGSDIFDASNKGLAKLRQVRQQHNSQVDRGDADSGGESDDSFGGRDLMDEF